MNAKVTVGLMVVLIALAGYVYFFEIQGDQEKPEAEEPATIYGSAYGEYDIVGLKIEGAQGTAQFIRTGAPNHSWKMVLPDTLPPEAIDQMRVNGAASRMGYLTPSRTITNATNLAQYGLTLPELSVTLTISNGQEIVLHTGDEAPINNNRYLKLAGDDSTIYLIFSFAVDDLRNLIDQPPLVAPPEGS